MEDQQPITTELKNPTLACVLSLICCGAGQLYNGEVPKAALMFFAAVASGVLFGIAALLLVIPLIAYGAVDAHREARRFNAAVRKRAEDTEEEEKRIADVRDKTISAEEFAGALSKTYELHRTGLLSAEEFGQRKSRVIGQLVSKKPRGLPEDFLSALIPLVKVQALSAEDVQQIKSMVL